MQTMVRPSRRGVVLLEAIVALAILSIAAVSLVSLVSTHVRFTQRVQQAELHLDGASQFLEYAALWPAAELNKRLGVRVQGQFDVETTRLSGTLYSVRVMREGTELLRTTLYRRESEPEQ